MSTGAYIGVSNSAKKLKNIYIGVGNSSKKVKCAYIGVNGSARLFYKSGTPISELPLGTVVEVLENGTLVDFLIVQIGNPDTSIYGSGCDGVWLIRKLLLTSRYQLISAIDSSTYYYYNSPEIQTLMNTTYFNMLGAGAQSSIVNAEIPYISKLRTDRSGLYSTELMSTKVFIPSITELGSRLTNSSDGYSSLGVKLDYFKYGDYLGYFDIIAWASTIDNPSSSQYRTYWTRSERTETFSAGNPYFWACASNGTVPTYKADEYLYLRPMFIVGKDTTIEELKV